MEYPIHAKTEVPSLIKDAASTNIHFYSALWSQTKLAAGAFQHLAADRQPAVGSPARLEVAPACARLPIAGSYSSTSLLRGGAAQCERWLAQQARWALLLRMINSIWSAPSTSLSIRG